MSEADRAEKWAAKLAERKERYQERGKLYRIGWVLLGALVTVAGCVMLITPCGTRPSLIRLPTGPCGALIQSQSARGTVIVTVPPLIPRGPPRKSGHPES